MLSKLHPTFRGAVALLLGLLVATSCDPSPRPTPDPVEPAAPEEVALFEPTGEQVSDPVQKQLDLEDPAVGNFTTEMLHDRAKPVLGALVSLFAAHHPENFTGKVVTDDFETSQLRPADVERIFDDGTTTIDEALTFSGERLGAHALPGLLQSVVDRLDHEEIQSKDKLYAIRIQDEAAGLFESDAIVRVAGPTEDGRQLQVNMEWRVGFHALGPDEVRIRSIEVVFYRQILTPGELFADLTKQAFASIPRFSEDFLVGTGDYHFRTDQLNGNAYTGSMGLAVGDVNGDGLDDVFVCQPGGQPNRMLVRRMDGGVDDRSVQSQLNLLTKTQSALILDFDNDGDQDLALACKNSVVLAENDGSGGFTLPRRPLVTTNDEITSLAAADYDRDGDLDLYACKYAKAGPLGTTPVPYHDAVNGPPNQLWRNDGGWEFQNVAGEVGLNDNNVKFSYAAIWEDFDRDGDPDLYVANDFGRNNFYRNDDGMFSDVAAAIGADDIAAGMGVTVADFDQDGQMDLYVTNMFSSAGRRIVPQPDFRSGEHTELNEELLRHARGNTLLLNEGDGTFRDATEQGRAVIAGWSWGSKALDLNNDGLPDVYSPNGWLTNEDPHDL